MKSLPYQLTLQFGSALARAVRKVGSLLFVRAALEVLSHGPHPGCESLVGGLSVTAGHGNAKQCQAMPRHSVKIDNLVVNSEDFIRA